MSNKYKHGDTVPPEVLCERLDALADAVTQGKKGIDREFYMSIPAQLDNDADLVISQSSKLITDQAAEIEHQNLVIIDYDNIIAERGREIERLDKLSNCFSDTITAQAEEIETLSTKLDEVAEYYASHYEGDPWREFEKQAAEIERSRALFKEAADYLDINSLTNIGSCSILHQKFREQAISPTGEDDHGNG